MDSFELIFGFFSLLIAFAFAELLNGFVFTARSGLINRSGALAMALAALVLVDLVTFWTQLWGLRTFIPPALGALLIATISCSLLFIAAKLVLPQEDSGVTLKTHFYSVRRIVIAAVIAANIAPIIMAITHNQYPMVRIAEQATWVSLFGVLALARKLWLLWTVVTLLTLFYGVAAVQSLIDPSMFDLSAIEEEALQ